MKEVDVIAEIRATRDRISEKYPTVHDLIVALREKSKAAGRKTVSFAKQGPQQPVPKKSAA
jgi:hypothetical protein